MLTQIINGKIFTPQGWLDEGSVLIRDNKILEVTNCDLALIGAKLIDAKGMYIVPGYVCMHAHGGGGHDFNECTEEAFRAAIKAHQKHGATSIFPTKLSFFCVLCHRGYRSHGGGVFYIHRLYDGIRLSHLSGRK